MKPKNLFEARTKVYTRRDSATKALKSIGLTADKYSDFIEATEDGFICHLDQAREHLAFHQPQPVTAPAKKTGKAKPTKGAKKEEVIAVVPPGHSISSAIQTMILEGLDNEQIREELKLDDKRRHYPAWYRARLRRSGQLA